MFKQRKVEKISDLHAQHFSFQTEAWATKTFFFFLISENVFNGWSERGESEATARRLPRLYEAG